MKRKEKVKKDLPKISQADKKLTDVDLQKIKGGLISTGVPPRIY